MNPSPTGVPPLLLLAEDDPVSAAFLADAITPLPARVRLVGSVAEALACCDAEDFALLLLDANLPDGQGAGLLALLRARGVTAPALAHTADRNPDTHARLQAAGFAEVLPKPMPIAALHAALRRHLPDLQPSCWDDAAALAALGGRQAHVDALRALFLGELPGQRERIVKAATHADITALRAELHKLAASCGFVGAHRLGAATHDLQVALTDPAALRALEAAIGELLAA